MSLLDYLVKRNDEVLSGTYYEHKPTTPDDSGVVFSYDIANPREVSYINLMQNINTNGQSQTIKTNSLKGFKVKSYIALQDGGLWQIVSYTQKPVKDENKQVLRVRKQSNGITYIIRLIEVYDTWEITK